MATSEEGCLFSVWKTIKNIKSKYINMKYGILQFKSTDNLGDDIISYSSSQFVHNPNLILDRENLISFSNTQNYDKIKILNSAWIMHNQQMFYNAQKISNVDMMFFSIHINSLKPYTNIIKNLKLLNFEVGCRDNNTLNICKQNGIKSYFSGCSTLLLNQFKKQQTDIIYCVDIKHDIVVKLQDKYKQFKFIEKTHIRIPSEMSYMSQSDREINVKSILTEYNNAYCVISTRLHAVLPCTALNTPTVLVFNNRDGHLRFNPYSNYVNCVASQNDLLNVDLMNIKPLPIVFNHHFTKKINDFLDNRYAICMFSKNDEISCKYLAFSLRSLFLTNKEFVPYVFFDNDISEKWKNILSISNPNIKMFFNLNKYLTKFGITPDMNHNQRPSFMWLKPLLGHIDELNQYDQIIYADTDIEYHGSLYDFWKMDFYNNELIGFFDYRKKDYNILNNIISNIDKTIQTQIDKNFNYRLQCGLRYVNMGFFKMNLALNRKRDPYATIAVGKKIHKYLMVNEQDYMNVYLKIMSFNNDIYNTIDNNDISLVQHYVSSQRKMLFIEKANAYLQTLS